MGLLDQVVVPVLVLIIGGILAWLTRAVFALQRLMEKESRPNGGSSTKDWMKKTADAVEANRSEMKEAISSVNHAIERQTEVLSGIRDDMREHNHQTNELVNTLIRSGVHR